MGGQSVLNPPRSHFSKIFILLSRQKIIISIHWDREDSVKDENNENYETFDEYSENFQSLITKPEKRYSKDFSRW